MAKSENYIYGLKHCAYIRTSTPVDHHLDNVYVIIAS